jgi:hypothetical protein
VQERQVKGAVLARHEREFREGARERLNLNELLALLGASAEGGGRSREDAIACYLAGGDGWREAVKMLGGTFAHGTDKLTKDKND